MIEKFDLFCFDFDGLLVDSESLHKQAYELALKEFSLLGAIGFYDYCFAAHYPTGNRLKDLYCSLFSQLDDPMWEEVVKKKQKHYAGLLAQSPLSLMPYAETMIETLLSNGKALCVVTNSRCQYTIPFRKALPILEEIPLWITRDDVAKAKPHPDGFLKALAHHPNVPKSRALGLDDALKGITAIVNAQITPILVCSKDHPQLALISPTLIHVESLEDLLKS